MLRYSTASNCYVILVTWFRDFGVITQLFITIHSIFDSEFKTLEFSGHSVVKCEFFFFSFFLAISVIDQTPFFNSPLNLTNSTAGIFTIKSSVGVDFVSECKGIVTAVTLIQFTNWSNWRIIVYNYLCILIEKMNEIGWKWSKLINDLEVCSNWFLELVISLENFIKTIAHFAIVSLFFAIVQSAKRVIDRTVPLVEKSLWLFVNFGRFVSS